MAYQIKLSPAELNSLKWMRERGYDLGIYDVLDSEDARAFEPADKDSSPVVYDVSESDAWDVLEAFHANEEGALACAPKELLVKLHAFIEEIV
jgi:hypothetical protein